MKLVKNFIVFSLFYLLVLFLASYTLQNKILFWPGTLVLIIVGIDIFILTRICLYIEIKFEGNYILFENFSFIKGVTKIRIDLTNLRTTYKLEAHGRGQIRYVLRFKENGKLRVKLVDGRAGWTKELLDEIESQLTHELYASR